MLRYFIGHIIEDQGIVNRSFEEYYPLQWVVGSGHCPLLQGVTTLPYTSPGFSWLRLIVPGMGPFPGLRMMSTLHRN